MKRRRLSRLIDTGMQRLVGNLDELPHPLVSLGLARTAAQTPHLVAPPIAVAKLHRYAGMVSLVTTHGCKFHCPYCPIPAYNQFTFRYKSPDRLRDEMEKIAERTNISAFFGTDDNFFNSREAVRKSSAV